MENKLQTIIEKVYNEGVSKAQKDSESILKEAQVHAEQIIEEAEQKASEIITKAEEKNLQLKSSVEKETRQFVELAFEMVKEDVAEKLSQIIVAPVSKEACNETAAIVKILCALASNKDFMGFRNSNFEAYLPLQLRDEFSEAIKRKTSCSLKETVSVYYDEQQKEGFTCLLNEGRIKISFTPHAIEQFFKHFAKPHIYSFLFET